MKNRSEMQTSRRRVIQGGSLALLGTALEARPLRQKPFFARHGLPIGLQLYTLGDVVSEDIRTALRTAADIGYRAVEISTMKGITAAAFSEALRSTGMTCNSMHVNPVADLPAIAESAHAIGVTYIMTSMVSFLAKIPPDAGAATGSALIAGAARMTADDWKRSADQLNETGAALKRLGLNFAYHNHNHEFAPRFGGQSGYDILLRDTDPALVSFEMDVGWVAAAGRDPVALLRAHRGRFTHMHVKDTVGAAEPNYEFKQHPADVGDGVLNWRAILPAAYGAGVRHFYVEREPPFTTSRIESARRSFDFLNRLVA
jgi:sugar phosphate isomerase/epimerase